MSCFGAVVAVVAWTLRASSIPIPLALIERGGGIELRLAVPLPRPLLVFIEERSLATLAGALKMHAMKYRNLQELRP